MKFLQKKWQNIIFWSIVGYLSFVLVVWVFMAWFRVCWTFSEYWLQEIEKYFQCVGTKSDINWCLFFWNLKNGEARFSLLTFPYWLIQAAF